MKDFSDEKIFHPTSLCSVMEVKMEIERKYLIKKEQLPRDYGFHPFHQIEQAYLCTEPVVRIRRQDEEYILTYKGKGLMVREEYNLPLTKESYYHLLEKADGSVLTKRRYVIPYGKHNIELDIFAGKYDGLILAEVEFDTEEDAKEFIKPDWFEEEVTFDSRYQNSTLSK